MKAREIYAFIDEISPFSSQESWDNSGLLLDNSGECSQLLCALDIDDALCDFAVPNSCVLVHHPLIFKGLKTLASGYEARILLKLAAKNCALIAAHTNFDKSHLNKYLCEEVFGFEILEQDEFLLYCKNPFAQIEELAEYVKKRLNLPQINAIIAERNLSKTLAVCSGSGAQMAQMVREKANIYLTGDIKYHDALAAKLNGLNMLDITHFASEKCFANAAALALKDLPISVNMGAFLNPFAYI